MAITTQSDMADPQILIDAVGGALRGRNAFMGSVLVSSGAVFVSPSMPKGGPGAIGKTIEIPYFGALPAFANNPDGSAITPSKLGQVLESATVARSSIAVETSVWAQGLSLVDPAVGDPYAEGTRQAQMRGVQEMDRLCVAEAATTPLVHDIYSASVPAYLNHREVIRARTKWADEQDAIVAMVTHSQAEADLAELTDQSGRPLLSDPQGTQGQGEIRRFAGVPLLVSDRVPLTGSSMGSVTSSGTSPPVVTLAGTPLGPWNLVVDCVVGGAHETATYRFSTDGGNTWSATLTTPAAAAVVDLKDTAVDSLVGQNGETGITIAFAAGTFNADNQWTATAKLKVTTLLLQQGAMAFWYAGDRLGTKQDVDILTDSDIIAMHLYHATKLYRRRRMGSRPGCVAIKHNVRNYNG